MKQNRIVPGPAVVGTVVVKVALVVATVVGSTLDTKFKKNI